MTVGSFFAGRLVIRFTRYKLVPMGGLVIGIAMLAAFAARPAGLSLAEVCALLAVGGAGIGVMYPVTTIMIQNTVAPHRLGITTGALNFARQLGGAMIVAAFSAIVLGGIDIGGHGLTLDMLRGGHATGVFAQSFTQVFRTVFAAGAVFLTLGLIAVVVIEERPLRGPGRHS
jgi:MFS family permease